MIIGFSTTNKALSRLIRWFTRSKASHAYLRFTVAGEELVLHSTRHGINFDHYSKFKSHNKVVKEYRILVDEATETEGLRAALRLIDQPYDFLSIAGFAWVLACRSIGLKVKAPFRNRAAYHCSEFGLTILRKLGLDCPGAKRELTSPEDLMSCLGKLEQAKEI